jgi:hypothetical protein
MWLAIDTPGEMLGSLFGQAGGCKLIIDKIGEEEVCSFGQGVGRNLIEFLAVVYLHLLY